MVSKLGVSYSSLEIHRNQATYVYQQLRGEGRSHPKEASFCDMDYVTVAILGTKFFLFFFFFFFGDSQIARSSNIDRLT